ncbi:MAG: tetratricopeptide repeat protein, partial [Polaromonas sp.]|nr:tetratricopeptide repeat protein [Polaromonas sp.]
LKEARQTLDTALALARSTTAGLADWNHWDLVWWQAQLGQAVDGGKDTDIRQAATELLSRLKQSAESASTPAQVFTSINATNAVAAILGSVQGNGQATLVQSIQIMQDALLARLLGLPSATAQELARGATLALSAGRLPLASDLFFAARRKTTAPEARLQFLQKGVQALLATGDSRRTWQAALREVQPLPPGDSTWWYLAQLALGAGEPREAGVALRSVIPVTADPTQLAKTLNAGQLQLAWDIFAAAGDLNAALLVSEAALLAEPKSALWLERKAQMSEWTGRAPQALAAWLELLRRGASARALENVFRLSPMLYDDDALLAAWLAVARQKQLSTEEVTKIIDTYERLGSVEGALSFLRNLRTKVGADRPGQLTNERTAQWLSLEAQLLNRAGRPDEAVAILEQLRPAGLSLPEAMLLANLQLKKGSLPLALRALRAARLTGPFNDAYWSLLADVAYESGERNVAQMALDQLIANGAPQSYQAERAIRLRIDANRVPEALQLAAQLYKRFPEDKIVYAWIDALGSQKNPTGMAGLMAALTEPHRRSLEASATFLERRGGLYAVLGKVPEAKRDYIRALQIKPDNPPVRTAYLWLLIDHQDRNQLSIEIAQLSRSEQRNAAYNEVLTAGWQLLGKPRQALALMQSVNRARSNDFLWLMSYADVLDTADRRSAALRVRRHAWLLAQRASARPANQEQARNALLTQLRLASEFAGGPDKARLWLDLGGLLKASQTSAEPAQKQQAQELVGAWLLSEGRFDAAQRWLWQQHAARLAVPAYQELAVALAYNDKAALARLLDKADAPKASTLSPQDRLSALRALGRQDESASLGTEQALSRAEGLDDEAQRALQEDLLATASSAGVRTRTRQDAVLTRQEIKTSAQLVLNPKLKLTFDLSSSSNRTRDTNVIASVPTRDREARVGIDTITPWGDLKAQALVRDALARVNGLYLQLTTKLNSQASLRMEAARNERSEESSAMALAGVRDRLGVTLNLRASDRFDGQVYLGSNRFRMQTGAALGNSLDAFVTGNLYLRRDYPDIRLQSQLRRSVMRATGQPDAPAALLFPGGTTPGVDFFLGPSSTAWSNSIGFGLAQSDPLSSYSRAWRPWGEIGFETRQTLGTTQTQSLLRLGIKGSVRGRDQLNLNLDVRPGTGGLSGAQGVRELRLQYDVYFDR